MPLLDHFQAPLSVHHPWQSIHSAWANAIVRHLNEGVLPEQYYALPNVQPSGRLEIDVATIDRGTGYPAEDAVATAVWAPARPTFTVPLDDPEFDVFEVQILNSEEGRLVAAVEMISPANKDRPASRRALAVKAASLLLQGVSVTLVDAVARRAVNWHHELGKILDFPDVEAAAALDLTATTYRFLHPEPGLVLEAWDELVEVGAELPTLPMWLSHDLAVPLDLEETYNAMCVSLRLHTS